MFADMWGLESSRAQGRDWFRQLMDEVFPDTGAADIRAVPRGTFPMINVGRTDEAVRVYIFAAGLAAENLDVSLQDNVLTVSGKREGPSVKRDDAHDASGPTHFRRERYQGAFTRSLALPDGLDIDRTEARFRDGICEVVLPKREELKPRRIEIQSH